MDIQMDNYMLDGAKYNQSYKAHLYLQQQQKRCQAHTIHLLSENH
jgi:hypothetical protein